MSATHTGGCLCGAVRYAATGEPRWIAHCHCRSCRKHTGSVVSTSAGFPREHIAFTGAAPGRYASSPGIVRSFCTRCGTPLAYESEQRATEIDILLGTLDDPQDFPPTLQVWTEERLPWLHIDEHLPRYPKTPRNSRREG
jgi:hypothetical protein